MKLQAPLPPFIRYVPLAPEEQDRLAERAAHGDSDAEATVIESITALVWNLVVGYTRWPTIAIYREDLMSDALIAAMQAIRRYDGRTRLTTYLVPCVQGVIFRSARKYLSPLGAHLPPTRRDNTDQRLFDVPLSLDAPMDAGSGTAEGNTVGNFIPAPEVVNTDEKEEHERHKLSRYLELLMPDEREVLLRRFGIERPRETHTEIGNSLGMSREWARQIEVRALAKIGIRGPGPVYRRRGRRYKKKGVPHGSNAPVSKMSL